MRSTLPIKKRVNKFCSDCVSHTLPHFFVVLKVERNMGAPHATPAIYRAHCKVSNQTLAAVAAVAAAVATYGAVGLGSVCQSYDHVNAQQSVRHVGQSILLFLLQFLIFWGFLFFFSFFSCGGKESFIAIPNATISDEREKIK